MAQTKEQKYAAAAQRAVDALKRRYEGAGQRPPVVTQSLAELKTAIGVRADDSSFDSELIRYVAVKSYRFNYGLEMLHKVQDLDPETVMDRDKRTISTRVDEEIVEAWMWISFEEATRRS